MARSLFGRVIAARFFVRCLQQLFDGVFYACAAIGTDAEGTHDVFRRLALTSRYSFFDLFLSDAFADTNVHGVPFAEISITMFGISNKNLSYFSMVWGG
jgi:hypothetical protein